MSAQKRKTRSDKFLLKRLINGTTNEYLSIHIVSFKVVLTRRPNCHSMMSTML